MNSCALRLDALLDWYTEQSLASAAAAGAGVEETLALRHTARLVARHLMKGDVPMLLEVGQGHMQEERVRLEDKLVVLNADSIYAPTY